MSFRNPSHVSATTGKAQSWCNVPCFRPHAITESRTVPTLWVLVTAIGPSRNPDSSTHAVPVISPLPFKLNHPAYTGSGFFAPRGRIIVTPVRTGPSPTLSAPSPRINVVCPTSSPATSVMAFSGPGVPSNGTPRSRARIECSGLISEVCAAATAAHKDSTAEKARREGFACLTLPQREQNTPSGAPSFERFLLKGWEMAKLSPRLQQFSGCPARDPRLARVWRHAPGSAPPASLRESGSPAQSCSAAHVPASRASRVKAR